MHACESYLTAEIPYKCVEVGAGILPLIFLKGPIHSDFLAIEDAAIEALQSEVCNPMVCESHKAIACAHPCDPVLDDLDLDNRAQRGENFLQYKKLWEKVHETAVYFVMP